jgi:hypothetical protein
MGMAVSVMMGPKVEGHSSGDGSGLVPGGHSSEGVAGPPVVGAGTALTLSSAALTGLNHPGARQQARHTGKATNQILIAPMLLSPHIWLKS